MGENLYSKEQKAVTDEYRKNFERIFEEINFIFPEKKDTPKGDSVDFNFEKTDKV